MANEISGSNPGAGKRPVMLAGMAVLAPVLADCLHSFCVVDRGIRFYQAELDHLDSMRYWLVYGIQVIITGLILWPFAKMPIFQRCIWLCLVGFWAWLAFQSEAVVK